MTGEALPQAGSLRLLPGTAQDLAEVMQTMGEAFDPRFGEAWTMPQCRGIVGMPGTWLVLAREGEEPAGFAIVRVVVDEAELLLIGVRPSFRRAGIGRAVIEEIAGIARSKGALRLLLEMREGNPAHALYSAAGFTEIGRRSGYYMGRDREVFDAITLARALDTPN